METPIKEQDKNMGDPMQYLNDECMLLILEFAGADKRGTGATSTTVLEPDFFDTVQNSDGNKDSAANNEPSIWSVTQAARFYYPLSLVNHGWKSLLDRLLAPHGIAVSLKETKGKEEAAMKWISEHGLRIGSLDASTVHLEPPTMLNRFAKWLGVCDTSQLTTAHIKVNTIYGGLWHENYQLQSILAAQSPKLQNLRIRTSGDRIDQWCTLYADPLAAHKQFNGLHPSILSMPSIQSVDLIIAGFGVASRVDDMFFSKLIEKWSSLRNFRLEWRQKLVNNTTNAPLVVKLESPTLEKLSLDRFSPYLHTRFDLSGCPNLQEYTLGKPRRHTRQSIVGTVPNNARCYRISRLARRARIAERRARRARDRQLALAVHNIAAGGDSDSEEDGPPPARLGGNRRQNARPRNPPPRRVLPIADSSDDSDTSNEPPALGGFRHYAGSSDDDSDNNLPMLLGRLLPPVPSSGSSSDSESSDSLEEEDDAENGDDLDGDTPNLRMLRL